MPWSLFPWSRSLGVCSTRLLGMGSYRSYNNRLKLIDLPNLEKRLEILGVTFLYKLINGDVYTPTLLGPIDIHIPSRTSRRFVLLKLPQCRTNYDLSNSFRLMCKMFNDHYHSLNLPVIYVNKMKSVILRN